MQAAIVCREFGWTLDEYLDQTKEFIDIVMSMMQNEAEAAERKNK